MNVRTWTLALVLALATATSATGCKKKADPGPSCRQIVSYMMRFRELGTFDERAAIADCRKQNWTAKQRTCMYTAKDLDAFGKCVPAMKIDPSAPKRPAMPEWHPKVDQPIETGPERLQREAAEKAAAEAAGGAAGSAGTTAPGAPSATAPAPSATAPAAPAAPTTAPAAPAPAPSKPM